MDVKKYDLVDFNETKNSSIEGGYYIVPQNGIGKQPINLPGAGFNRSNPNSYQTILQSSALMNSGKMGTVSAGLGTIGILLSSYKDIRDTIRDIEYGDFHRELMNSIGKPLSDVNIDGICPVNEGEIKSFYWEVNFDNKGYAHIEFQNGVSIGERAKADYSHQVNVGGKGISTQKYNEIKSQAEGRVKQYNQIKEFNDRASEPRTSSQSYDYNDVPVINGGGGGGGSSSFQRPTALV